jgi:hypothetical protein
MMGGRARRRSMNSMYRTVGVLVWAWAVNVHSS